MMLTVNDFSDMFVPQEISQKSEQVLGQLNAIVKMARECLNTQQFQQYKTKFEKEEKQLLDVMIAYTNTFILNENANPAMYGLRMAMYIQKLYDLRRLLKNVEADASRKIGESNEKF